jgi:hypothetical protein
MNENELQRKEVWNGVYRGVSYEIVHWYLGWNYYLNIPIEQLPTDEIKKTFNLHLKSMAQRNYYYDYSSASIISDLDWHGGITLYEKVRRDNGVVNSYRLGCDYMHYWDENHDYHLGTILRDTKNSIDKLWQLIPDLKVRCAWNGKYYPVNETYLTDKGVRVALENKEAWNKPLKSMEDE